MEINAPGHVTSPLSKVKRMNKEMDRADKENKKTAKWKRVED